jgi:hypothetical protein
METVMDVLNRLSLNARVMDKIIKLFYKSVVLYDEICKDQEETAEDLLLMKIQTIKKFDHDWREYLYKNPEAKESGLSPDLYVGFLCVLYLAKTGALNESLKQVVYCPFTDTFFMFLNTLEGYKIPDVHSLALNRTDFLVLDVLIQVPSSNLYTVENRELKRPKGGIIDINRSCKDFPN